jgi:hypothetical protein
LFSKFACWLRFSVCCEPGRDGTVEAHPATMIKAMRAGRMRRNLIVNNWCVLSYKPEVYWCRYTIYAVGTIFSAINLYDLTEVLPDTGVLSGPATDNTL